MNFIFYRSLKPGAKAAVKRGPGHYRKYAITKVGPLLYIAYIIPGRPLDYSIVVKGTGPTIKETKET